MGEKLECSFTEDKSKLSQADAVWFHAPSTSAGNLPPQKLPGQKWVAMSMESAANYPILENKDWMGKMDIHMTYRLDSGTDILSLSNISFHNVRDCRSFRSLLRAALWPVFRRCSNDVSLRGGIR